MSMKRLFLGINRLQLIRSERASKENRRTDSLEYPAQTAKRSRTIEIREKKLAQGEIQVGPERATSSQHVLLKNP